MCVRMVPETQLRVARWVFGDGARETRMEARGTCWTVTRVKRTAAVDSRCFDWWVCKVLEPVGNQLLRPAPAWGWRGSDEAL